jgi:hypothetical protein
MRGRSVAVRPAVRVRRCAKGAAALLVGVSGFQVALAAGAPWGEATQGGRAANVDGVL